MLPEVTIVCDAVLHTVQDVARGGMCFSGVLSCTSFVYNVYISMKTSSCWTVVFLDASLMPTCKPFE